MEVSLAVASIVVGHFDGSSAFCGVVHARLGVGLRKSPEALNNFGAVMEFIQTFADS